jgi:preprotein translocase subunit SecF
MGFTDALMPIVFFIICIFSIAQASITIKTYLDTKKTKDASFNFSAFILTVSLIGLMASGFMTYKAFKGGASANAPSVNAAAAAAAEVAVAEPNISAQQMGLANQLENVSANAAQRAAKAAEGAKLANALGATLGQLKKAN